MAERRFPKLLHVIDGRRYLYLEKIIFVFSLSTINYKVSQKVTKFSIFSDPTRKLSAVPPELRRIR